LFHLVKQIAYKPSVLTSCLSACWWTDIE